MNKLEKLQSVLYKKDCLFLERGNYLEDCIRLFYNWIVENKIEHNILFDLSNANLDYIKNQINRFDVIVFQTTWTYEISHTLYEYLKNLKDKKIIIECYINEPSWYYKPKGIIHDVFILNPDEDIDNWELNKLTFRR